MPTYNKRSLSLIILIAIFFTGCGENEELIAKKELAMCEIAAHKQGSPILIDSGQAVAMASGGWMIYMPRDGGKGQWGILCKFEETWTIITSINDVINDNGSFSWVSGGSQRVLNKDLEP